MTDSKEPRSEFSFKWSEVSLDPRQHLDDETREDIRETFGGGDRTEKFIERIEVRWEEWYIWRYSGRHVWEGKTTLGETKKTWGKIHSSLDKFLKAYDELTLDEQNIFQVRDVMKKMQGHVEIHIDYLGGLKPQTGTEKPRFWLHQFTRALVLAYFESFEKRPLYSRDSTDFSFVYLVLDLAESAKLSPPKSTTSMEKYIGPAIQSVRADFPDVK